MTQQGTGIATGGPVFFQDAIERNAPAVLSCLARIVNELLLMQASGATMSTELRRETGNAVALIMKATAPLECPVDTQKTGA